jgi:hypothetical protein
VILEVDATARELVVWCRKEAVKRLPIKGLGKTLLAFDDFVDQLRLEAPSRVAPHRGGIARQASAELGKAAEPALPQQPSRARRYTNGRRRGPPSSARSWLGLSQPTAAIGETAREIPQRGAIVQSSRPAQSQTWPLERTTSARHPSGLEATRVTRLCWTDRGASACPLRASHSRAVRSFEPVSRRCPSEAAL